jgi:glutamine amidotransferase
VIGVIDYGVGNVQAFLNLFKRIGTPAKRVVDSESLNKSSHLILPGVGHFDHAMKELNSSGLRNELDRLVMIKKVPVLGVCVGMQMLSEGSDEGDQPGLGWIPGRVRSMRESLAFKNNRLPHMGWNNLQINSESSLFSRGFELTKQFYFLHSYYFEAYEREDVMATAEYGSIFDVVVSRNNIHGVQCHPEKSHYWGEQLLKNFVELT